MNLHELIGQIANLSNPSVATVTAYMADNEIQINPDDVAAAIADMRANVSSADVTPEMALAATLIQRSISGDAADSADSGEPAEGESADDEKTESEETIVAGDENTSGGGEVVSGELVTTGAGTETAEFSRRDTDRMQIELNRGHGIRRPGSASNAFYEAFNGDSGSRIESSAKLATTVSDRLDRVRRSGRTGKDGLSLVTFRGSDEWQIPHRTPTMSDTEVLGLMDTAVDLHQRQSIAALAGKSIQEFANTGWCAPSVDRYEFCPLPSTTGMFADAIPMITTERGGTRWPAMPPIGDLWGQGVLCQTEAEVMEREEDKPCTEIPCVEWDDFRNHVCSLCVISSILTQRAFPELVNNFVQTYLILFEHWISWQMLQLAIAAADEQNGAHRWNTSGWGIFNALKEKIEFAISSIASRNMLGTDESSMIWNVALPQWAFSAIRADLSKRPGTLDFLSVSDAQIRMMLSGGKQIRFWPLAVWQTSLVAPPDADMAQWIGSQESLDSGVYPNTMEVLVWPEGAFVGVRENFLDLRGRLEYPLLRQNKRLELFTESEWNLIPRCYEAVHFTLDICTAGRYSAPFEFPCNPNLPAPAPGA